MPELTGLNRNQPSPRHVAAEAEMQCVKEEKADAASGERRQLHTPSIIRMDHFPLKPLRSSYYKRTNLHRECGHHREGKRQGSDCASSTDNI